MLDHHIAPESREAISERLRLTREALAASQTEWCRRTGIATNTWSNFEKGRNRISLDEAFKISRAYGVTLDWIYRGDASGLPLRIVDPIRAKLGERAGDHRLSA